MFFVGTKVMIRINGVNNSKKLVTTTRAIFLRMTVSRLIPRLAPDLRTEINIATYNGMFIRYSAIRTLGEMRNVFAPLAIGKLHINGTLIDKPKTPKIGDIEYKSDKTQRRITLLKATFLLRRRFGSMQ